jgi:hypothetical protein
MRRRDFIAGLGGAVAWPLVARAQKPAMPVIGYLTSRSRDDDTLLRAHFLRGLSLTESHSLLAMAAVILPRCGNGIGWRRAAAGDVR